MVSAGDYLAELRRQVSDEERDALEKGDMPLINPYNRATVLRMLHSDAPDGAVDTEQAGGLRNALTAYLNEYMADQPAAHKWIILCCLYLAMVVREPMHPQQMAGWRKRDDGYSCPAREDHDGSVCRWCVCRRADNMQEYAVSACISAGADADAGDCGEGSAAEPVKKAGRR